MLKYKIGLSLIFALHLGHLVYAQNRIVPGVPIKDKSFMIMVDELTLKNCKEDILSYKQVLESEGLPTFIVSSNWESPDAIKKEVLHHYEQSKLEGIVLIGDIPIPLIRKAQHLATAFKMDEKLDIFDSSVPSDRFYDTFDLKFEFIKQDEKKPLLYYYNLAIDAPNHIQSQIYSGRIKPLVNGEDKYLQIRNYLKKAVLEHQAQNKLDQVVSYLGDGTLSNSLTAWNPEQSRLEEQFPNVFINNQQAQFFRFDFWNYPKEEIINQLRRENLDVVVFHEHGMPDRQYLSGEIPSTSAEEHATGMQTYLKRQAIRETTKGKTSSDFMAPWKKDYYIDSTWIEGFNSAEFAMQDSLDDLKTGIIVEEVYGIQPNARFILFDACYNGDFREDDYIAGRYIFSPGKTVVTLANTVSVLQDVSSTHMMGLLGLGTRIGQWARFNNILESHIIGDPTLRFYPNETIAQLEDMLSGRLSQAMLLERAKNSPNLDLQNLALTQLYRQNYNGISALLKEKFISSPYAVTRLTCMELLSKQNDSNYYDVLKLATKDSDELIRRLGINQISKVGHPDFLPYLIEGYIENQHSKRVLFSLKMAIHAFSIDDVKKAADPLFAKSHFINKEKFKKEFLALATQGFYGNINKETFDKTIKASSRKLYINSLKNLNYHPTVDKYNAMLFDSEEPEEIRVWMLQSLAWFGHSYRKAEIVSACERLIASTTSSALLKEEAQRTINTLN